MDIKEIFSRVDHTALAPDSAWSDIETLCEDAVKYRTASVCIPPSFVGEVKRKYGDSLKICTVIGFPNGYSTTAVKVFETSDAVANGADEIDMVINIGWVKDKKYDDVLAEIRAVRNACEGKILKVIIETCLLTDQEKTEMCRVVSQSGADFIKTSTGFSKGGATREDIKLFAENISGSLKIKAAGGIASIQGAEDFIALGAERLGTSRIIRKLKEAENNG